MPAKKTTVTHADGTVSTRKSQTRTYSHAVEIGPATAAAAAAGKVRAAEKLETRAATLRAAATAGRVVIRDRGLGLPAGDDLYSHEAILMGVKTPRDNHSVYTWCGADGRTETYRGGDRVIVNVNTYLIESATSEADHYEADAAKLRTEAAEIVAAGAPVGGYWIVRWSSRADLAHKALAEFAHLTDQGYPVRVVAVDA